MGNELNPLSQDPPSPAENQDSSGTGLMSTRSHNRDEEEDDEDRPPKGSEAYSRLKKDNHVSSLSL